MFGALALSSSSHVCTSGDARATLRMCVADFKQRTALQICKSRFRAGDWWEWLYKDGAGQPSSWERYSVRACSGDELVVDMATKFESDDPYHVHHRMRLSVTDGLRAERASSQWQFREFAFCQDGIWCAAPHTDNVQAFEEKFHLPMMVPTLPLPVSITAQRERQIAALGSQRANLMQSRRYAYTNSWYVREPRSLAGVAAFKAFGPEGRADTYTFELVAMGSLRDVSDLGGLSTEANGRSGLG